MIFTISQSSRNHQEVNFSFPLSHVRTQFAKIGKFVPNMNQFRKIGAGTTLGKNNRASSQECPKTAFGAPILSRNQIDRWQVPVVPRSRRLGRWPAALLTRVSGEPVCSDGVAQARWIRDSRSVDVAR